MVRVFKEEKGRRRFYAVTGHRFVGTKGSIEMARAEVARFKKESAAQAKKYRTAMGIIAPYTDELDGLWFEHELLNGCSKLKGERCVIVYKEAVIK